MAEPPEFVVEGGAYMNPPPCLRLSKFSAVCETSYPCKLLGGFGPVGLQLYRVPIMYAAAAVSFFSIVLCIVPLVSFATDAETIRNVHWTHADAKIFVGDARVDSFDAYISIRGIALFGFQGDDPSVIEFEDDDCDEEFFPYCEDCIDSSEDTESVVILAFVTTVLQLVQDLQRSSYAGDFNCQRFLGIIFGIVGAFSTLQAIKGYHDGCGRSFPTTVYLTGGTRVEYEYSVGPSLFCLYIATVLKFFDVLCHWLIVTPGPKRGEHADDLMKTFWSEPRQEMERQMINAAYAGTIAL